MMSRIIRSLATVATHKTSNTSLLNSHNRCVKAHNACRAYGVQRVSKNLSLIVAPDRKVTLEKDQKSPAQKIVQTGNRPLVVMIPWLMAKPTQLYNYATLYTSLGFDMLAVRVRPWHVLLPTKGSQVVAIELLDFLRSNEAYNPIVLHGFSVGGYIWGECCLKIHERGQLYKPVVDRVAGQVWDSAVDFTQTPTGLSRALFPKNMMLQNALHDYVKLHMRTFHDMATRHYIRSTEMFTTNLVRAPALFLVSKTDSIGSEESNRKLRDNWERQGIQTRWKCWDCSPHVGHYRHHPKEYAAELNSFLTSLNLEVREAED